MLISYICPLYMRGMNTKFPKLVVSGVNRMLMLVLCLMLTSEAYSQTIRTWTNGNGTNLWSDAGNWSGGVVPTGIANRALFNGTSTANCTIDVNVSCDGIEMTSAYTGTITQSGSVTISLDNSDFIQAGGTFNAGSGSFSTVNAGTFTVSGGAFNAGSGNISLTGTLTVSGGTFTGGTGTISSNSALSISSGTFTCGSENCTFSGFTQTGGSFTSTPKTFRNNGNFVRNTAGTFAHNSGPWLQANTANVAPNFSQPTTFYRFIYNPGAGPNFTHTAGQSMTVIESCRILSGDYDNTGFTVYVQDTLELNNTGRTEPDFEFTGTGGKVFLATVASTSDVTVNLTNQSDELYVYKGTGSTINIGNGTGASFVVTSGQVKFESGISTTIDVNNLDVNTGASFFLAPSATTRFIGTMNNTGGRFHGASGTLALDISGRPAILNTDVIDTVFNLVIDKTGAGNTDDAEVASGDVLAVSNLLTITNGDINNGTGNNGEFRVLKDMTVNGRDIVNTNFRIGGSGNSIITFNSTLNNAATIFIDKANATDQVTFTSSGTTTDGSGGDLEIVKGILNFGTTNASLNYDNITISGADGEFVPASGNTNIYGNLLNNAGKISAPNGSTVTFNGNFAVGSGSILDVQSGDVLHNLIINKNHSGFGRQMNIPSGDVVLLNGDLTVTSGSRLLGGSIDLKGDMTLGALNAGMTTNIEFSGSADQTVTNGSAGQIDGNLTINKPNLTHVLLASDVLLDNGSNLVTFTNGHLRITTGSLTISGSALVNGSAWYTGASENSFVFGTIQIRNCTGATFNTTFPTGDSIWYNGGGVVKHFYAPIGFQSTTTQGNQTTRGFNASYSYQWPINSGNTGTNVDHVSKVEYWNLDRISSTVNGRVTLSWRPKSYVNDLASLLVVRYDGTNWVKSTATSAHTTTGDTLNGTITATDPFTTFSPFTLGGGTVILNPLPVNFVSVKAFRLEQNTAQVNWMVSDEKEVVKYEIERSLNGTAFETVGSVAAKGMLSGIENYSFVDYTCPKGIVFYRIKEISTNSSSYSRIVSVAGTAADLTNGTITVVPNPVNSGASFTVNLDGVNEESKVSYSLIDLNGKKVLTGNMNIVSNNATTTIPAQKLTPGLYFISILNNGVEIRTQKILINP